MGLSPTSRFHQRGFNTIEVLVGMSILVIAVALVSGHYRTAGMQRGLKAVTGEIESDLKRAGFGVAGIDVFPIMKKDQVGFISWQKARQDISETVQNARMAKSKFAEAAAYLGLAMVNSEGATEPVCVTHDSTGKVPETGPAGCGSIDLSGFDRVYAKGNLALDPKTKWIANALQDAAETLTGTLKEKIEIKIKIWQPKPGEVRVVGRGTVNGRATDTQLFGERAE